MAGDGRPPRLCVRGWAGVNAGMRYNPVGELKEGHLEGLSRSGLIRMVMMRYLRERGETESEPT